MMPWKLLADPSGYIFTWLVGYSALLGPVGGHHDRRLLRLPPQAARRPRRSTTRNGRYRYSGGWSIAAIAAFVVAVLPNLPGFLAQVGVDRPVARPARSS